MNKYEREWKEKELKSNQREDQLLNQVMDKIKITLVKLSSNEKDVLLASNSQLFSVIMTKIYCFDAQTITLILQELKRSTFCKNTILLSSLRSYINSFYKDNKQLQQDLTESMKIHGLIQNIMKIKDKTYRLITPNNYIIDFCSGWPTEEHALKAAHDCHALTHLYLNENAKDRNFVANVCRIKNLFGDEIYHSFISEDDNIYDLANNLIMKSKNYNLLFEPKIIAQFTKEELNNSIKQLQKYDKDFTSTIDNNSELLKCAMAKQMKKEKRYYI